MSRARKRQGKASPKHGSQGGNQGKNQPVPP